jgi:hypothetical protein
MIGRTGTDVTHQAVPGPECGWELEMWQEHQGDQGLYRVREGVHNIQVSEDQEM